MIANSVFLIVEDELLIAETIADFLRKEGCEQITMVESVEDAVKCIETGHIDFVLTDIKLGKMKTGIDLGNLLHTKYHIPFIYITSHADKTMIDLAKHTRPTAYIVKPFKREDLLIAIELGLYNVAHSPVKHEDNEEITVKDGRAMVRLYHSNILWLESDGNYTIIHLKESSRRVIRTALSELEEQLPATKFIRIHKSCIINKKQVTELRPNVVIINNEELPIGRTYQSNVADIFK